MSSMWRRAMLYLGLGPDDEYDDYDVVDEVQPAPGPPRHAPPEPPEPPTGAVRPLPREVPPPEPAVMPRPRTGVVRPIAPQPATSRPLSVAPGSFNDAQEIADKFMQGTPVIMNLQGVERDLSRRLVDFASGLCYGLQGTMERVANHVYLLTPANAEVSAEERRRLHERTH